MTRLELMVKSSKLLRDESNTIYTKSFIYEQINESIDRFKQLIPELKGMTYLTVDSETPILLPEEYHHLLSIYACARCYEVDERHYEATKYMNEYEVKVANLKDAIASGEIVITDPNTGNAVVVDIQQDFVRNMYFVGREDMDDETTYVQM